MLAPHRLCTDEHLLIPQMTQHRRRQDGHRHRQDGRGKTDGGKTEGGNTDKGNISIDKTDGGKTDIGNTGVGKANVANTDIGIRQCLVGNMSITCNTDIGDIDKVNGDGTMTL